MKVKGEKERHTHLKAKFQRIARRDKKAFLSIKSPSIQFFFFTIRNWGQQLWLDFLLKLFCGVTFPKLSKTNKRMGICSLKNNPPPSMEIGVFSQAPSCLEPALLCSPCSRRAANQDKLASTSGSLKEVGLCFFLSPPLHLL